MLCLSQVKREREEGRVAQGRALQPAPVPACRIGYMTLLTSYHLKSLISYHTGEEPRMYMTSGSGRGRGRPVRVTSRSMLQPSIDDEPPIAADMIFPSALLEFVHAFKHVVN